MARSLLALVLAISVGACQASGQPIHDPSGILVQPSGVVGCTAEVTTGQLIADADAGIAIEDGQHLPIVWPASFRARTVNGTVEVLDTAGTVVAQTGTNVRITGGQIDGRWLACGDGSPRPS
ncbi:MAG TPA: hypothetical protein VFI34_09580 [Candidatus Limnocylindrales bacterium]|nr:hypothetical protein [Candidatus Limnocylindrales bacterium]